MISHGKLDRDAQLVACMFPPIVGPKLVLLQVHANRLESSDPLHALLDTCPVRRRSLFRLDHLRLDVRICDSKGSLGRAFLLAIFASPEIQIRDRIPRPGHWRSSHATVGTDRSSEPKELQRSVL
jgi:hypothetical protein